MAENVTPLREDDDAQMALFEGFKYKLRKASLAAAGDVDVAEDFAPDQKIKGTFTGYVSKTVFHRRKRGGNVRRHVIVVEDVTIERA